MSKKEFTIIGRLGNLKNDEEEYQFLPNDNFQSAIFAKVEKLYMIFTEHRVFFVEVKKFSKQNSKYWISFKDDGVKEEFDKRKSAKIAIPEHKYFAVAMGEEYEDITDFKAYENDLFLGKIVNYIYTAGHRVIVIVDNDDNELLIPEVDYYLHEVDQDKKIAYFQNTQSLREL